MASGNQPPSGILMALAAKNAMSTARKKSATRDDRDDVPAPHQRRGDEGGDGVDEHGAGDGDAVGGSEVGRALWKADDQRDNRR